MGNPRRLAVFAIFAATLSLLASCRSYLTAKRLKSTSREGGAIGIPYALTKPTFVLKEIGPSDKQPGTRYQLDVKHVPDADHLYAIDIHSPLFSTVTFKTKFGETGALAHVNGDVDDGVVDMVKSIGDFVAQAIGVAVDVAKSQVTGGATAALELAAGNKDFMESPPPRELVVVFPHTQKEAFDQFVRRLESAVRNNDVQLGREALRALQQLAQRWDRFKGADVRNSFLILPDEERFLLSAGRKLVKRARTVASAATIPTSMSDAEQETFRTKYEELLKSLRSYEKRLKADSLPSPKTFVAFREDVTPKQRLLVIALQFEGWTGRALAIGNSLNSARSRQEVEKLRLAFEPITNAARTGIFDDLWSTKRLTSQCSSKLESLYGNPSDDGLRAAAISSVEQLAAEFATLGNYVSSRWQRLFLTAGAASTDSEKLLLQELLSWSSTLANLDLELSVVTDLVDRSTPQWQFAYLKILEKQIARLRRDLVIQGETVPSERLEKLLAQRAFLLNASNEHARAQMLRKELQKAPITRSSSRGSNSTAPAYDQYAKAREELEHIETVLAQRRSSLSTAAKPSAAPPKPKDEPLYPLVLHGGATPKDGKKVAAQWVADQVAKRCQPGDQPPKFVVVLTRGARNGVEVPAGTLQDNEHNDPAKNKEAKQ